MANKLISQLTAGSANVQDVDLIEAQKNGELITKKFTGLQMRAVEKSEREAQDNVIEAGAGLNANGTFTAPANSWRLRSADFAAGCVDRSGATGAMTENIVNGLRLLDALVYELGNGSVVVAYMGVDSDTTYANVIPAGYMLEHIIVDEKAGASPILDLGTTAGGNQVFINQYMQTSALTTITINRTFSLVSNTTLYLNDDDAGSSWDGSTVDLYFVLKPITAGGSVAATYGTMVITFHQGAYAFGGPPDNTMIEAILGSATGYSPGSIFLLYDTVGNDISFVVSTGTTWFVNGSSFSPAA